MERSVPFEVACNRSMCDYKVQNKPISTYAYVAIWVMNLLLSYIKSMEEAPPTLLLSFKTTSNYQNNVVGKHLIVCFVMHLQSQVY